MKRRRLGRTGLEVSEVGFGGAGIGGAYGASTDDECVRAIRRAVENGVGIAMLPDYLVGPDSQLEVVLPDYEVPSFDCFFVYPEELKASVRVTVFRDFLIANARRWNF